MQRHQSVLETLAALDYDGELPYRAAIYRARLAERGSRAAFAFLRSEAAPGDRDEVLRLAQREV